MELCPYIQDLETVVNARLAHRALQKAGCGIEKLTIQVRGKQINGKMVSNYEKMVEGVHFMFRQCHKLKKIEMDFRSFLDRGKTKLILSEIQKLILQSGQTKKVLILWNDPCPDRHYMTGTLPLIRKMKNHLIIYRETSKKECTMSINL